MSKKRPYRRGIAERAGFYLVIYGIGATAIVVGGLFDSYLWARRRLLRRERRVAFLGKAVGPANEPLTTD